ncbi:MAG: hypothetical protein DLM55_03840 [Acidimicrobiales bacterium]|nr:MAG: hypothetical protein DLM55_03840 [Acidimicrobiales bacterium]
MPRSVVAPDALRAALRALDAGERPDPVTLQAAVLHLLHALARKAPGRAVEVRVPPYGAVQCDTTQRGDPNNPAALQAPTHRRGTPPNVVETDPVTWLLVATGQLSWPAAIRDGRLTQSGVRADLSSVLVGLW